ncbi:protein 4.1 isoform X6 [Xiphophorus hellerii]|uniref:protein 4.1 isoform X6 n=1 Tax=Xiphophorus hellerii TaxID=8084 RepID=UPI0013B386A7|nr:protein 4.1 isoform X6 [Xiphophorus hellerii]
MTTDEVESHQKKPKQQQEEAGQDSQLHCHEDDNLQPQNQNSTSRGLSRLFSSLLKRRSQYDSEGGQREDEEDEAKAPIADPEPELKIEGEVALDQHSVSSAEVQALQAEKKDATEDMIGKVKEKNDQKGEAVVLDKEEDKEKEFGSERRGKEDKEKTTEEEAKTPRAPRRPKTLQIKVTLLDDALFECELDKHAKGQELFMKVCDHLNLLEKDYYGLAIWETPTMKTWMDLTKEIRRQVQGANYNFTFNVKFYPPDPAQLSEDITRYYLCLQLRKDILQGRLPCSFVTLALLGSYALQSELGEYDPEVHGNDYAKEMKMASGQTKELEDKMMELHRTYRIMCPAQADLMFLENAKKLSMYGVDLHQAKDLDGVDIMLGVCSSGLMVYKDKLRINRFPWPKVLKVSYKHSSFFIKIRPSETEQYESAIGFKLPNYKAAKKLWKVCVEHHTFFRLTSTEMATTPRKFLALGSKFRYSGRTQAQTRQASSLIDRPAPMFQRSSSKRNSRSLDGAMATTPDNKSNRPVSAPVMSPVSPGEAKPSPLLPTLPRHSHLDGSTPKSQRHTDWKRELKTECKPEHTKSHSPKPQSASEIKTVAKRERRNSSSMTNREKEKKSQDLDKTQTEIMRHHTSISELKRSFMESVPEPRPSEWDKRLSTNSPLRSVSLNGQLQPASPVLRAQTVTISDVTNSLRGTVTYKDIPLVHTETKTITYESAQEKVEVDNLDNKLQMKTDQWRQKCELCAHSTHGRYWIQLTGLVEPVETLAEKDSGVLLSAQTITSETISTTTTTQITKTVKGGISETRIEKRIVITGDTAIDHDKALAQAIKEAKEQHPDMSVTKVVVHQETEITPD